MKITFFLYRKHFKKEVLCLLFFLLSGFGWWILANFYYLLIIYIKKYNASSISCMCVTFFDWPLLLGSVWSGITYIWLIFQWECWYWWSLWGHQTGTKWPLDRLLFCSKYHQLCWIPCITSKREYLLHESQDTQVFHHLK